MPTAASAGARFSPVKCGKRRDLGKRLISASMPTPAALSAAMKSSIERVEWPMVKTVIAMLNRVWIAELEAPHGFRDAVLSRCRPGGEIGPAIFQRMPTPDRVMRSRWLGSCPHRRALFQCLWRLFAESAAVPRRRGRAQQDSAAHYRRGTAGLQQSAEACRRDRDARCDLQRPGRNRLRTRLP